MEFALPEPIQIESKSEDRLILRRPSGGFIEFVTIDFEWQRWQLGNHPIKMLNSRFTHYKSRNWKIRMVADAIHALLAVKHEEPNPRRKGTPFQMRNQSAQGGNPRLLLGHHWNPPSMIISRHNHSPDPPRPMPGSAWLTGKSPKPSRPPHRRLCSNWLDSVPIGCWIQSRDFYACRCNGEMGAGTKSKAPPDPTSLWLQSSDPPPDFI